MKQYYEQIFKRKSFHVFRNAGDETFTKEELQEIIDVYHGLTPLYPDIRTDVAIRTQEESECKRGNEYTIYFYSEVKENYLQNIGYLGEQLDLYLTGKNIGTLWYGIGQSEEVTEDGLKFVIMMGIKKVPEHKFRKDMFKRERKPLEEMWRLTSYQEIGEIARFAPSACNSQPWLVEGEASKLIIYRHKKPGKCGIMPVDKVSYYNRIDMGIFLCVLEICLSHGGYEFERKLFTDEAYDVDMEIKTKIAEYELQ